MYNLHNKYYSIEKLSESRQKKVSKKQNCLISPIFAKNKIT
jgi:hypothetical protein